MTGRPSGHDRPVALVTGAARGIGRATALALAGHGYDMVINYSVSEAAAEQVAQEVRACDAGALVVRADVADETAVRQMVATAADTYGRIDALINNAGTTIDVPPSDLTASTWRTGTGCSPSTCAACSASPGHACPCCAPRRRPRS